MKILKILQHALTLAILVVALVAYIWSVARGDSHPIHGHVIFWLAWVGVGAVEAVFLIHDLDK